MIGEFGESGEVVLPHAPLPQVPWPLADQAGQNGPIW